MDNGIDAILPAWAQALIAIGATLSLIAAGFWRGVRGAPEVASSRGDVLEVLVREQLANREILLQIRDAAISAARTNEEMAALLRSEADDSRMALIADRVARRRREEEDEAAKRK